MSSQGPPSKKPTGARPNVRKLLSKDSLPSLASITKHSREPSQTDKSNESFKSRFRAGLPPLGEIKRSESEPQTWVNEELVTSPTPVKEENNPFDDQLGKTVRLSVSKPTLNSDSSSSLPFSKESKEGSTPTEHDFLALPTPPPHSPSRDRWNQIRQHILQPSSEGASPNPSFTSFSQLNLSTPSQVGYAPTKTQPSRFAARLGFRHVVVEAREANDLTRQFSEDIHRACWTVRFGDSRHKPEREGTQQTLGSTLHLPFMSSGSLPLSANASSGNLSAPGSSSKHIRGATSMSTLAYQSSARMSALMNLRDIIMRYGVYVSQEKTMSKYLPHEKEILSVLQIAFNNSRAEQFTEEERRLSLEIFELIIQSWRAADADGELERCLWCCKAATIRVSPLRTRILYLLSARLSSEDSPVSSPISIPSILSSLILLIIDYNELSNARSGSLTGDEQNLKYIHELIFKIINGDGYAKFDPDELEPRYGAITVNSDDEKDLRKGICMEVIVRCLEAGTYKQKRSVLRLIGKYWELPDLSAPSTPLRSKIHLTKLNVFLRAVLQMLRKELQLAEDLSLAPSDLKLIGQLLVNKVIPEINHFKSSSEELANKARSMAVHAVLILVCCERDEEEADDTFADPKLSQMQQILIGWLAMKSSPWKDSLQKELKNFASSADWPVVVAGGKELLSVLPETTKKLVAGLIIPQFQERLVDDPPTSFYEPLASLLTTFASIFPQVFYKPLFVCAASTKEEIIAHQLSIVIVIASYMPNFWIGDAEMMSVALMSDPGVSKGARKENEALTWGKPRLGQMTILLELIGRLRGIRTENEGKRGTSAVGEGNLMARTIKFATALETRLAVLIDAKEQLSLMALSQRILFSTLFFELRLITGNLRPTAFLSRIITWVVHHNDERSDSTPSLPIINEDNYHEVEIVWEKLRVVYSLTKSGFQPKNQRRSTILFSANMDQLKENSREEAVDGRLKLLDSLSTNPLTSLLKAIVALYGALKIEDLVQLGSLIWDKCLLLNDTKAVIYACFICMLCADKIPDRFVNRVLDHLESSNTLTRKESIQKISIISNWRFQLLSLTYLSDRTRRHPFKLARPPFSFVATDVGETNYIPDEDDEAAGGQTHALPLDIRRRLHEIGWDDEEKQTDQLLEWKRTPMSLLGISQLDQISASDRDDGHLSDQSHSPAASPSGSPSRSSDSSTGLLRRNSSSHGRSGKRRPVFVLPLASVFKSLVNLTMDPDFEVSIAARDLILDYMRDDPAILCRSAMEILSKDAEPTEKGTSILRILLHLNKVLPPRFTHYVFNHLAGFLKTLAKDTTAPDTLHDLAIIAPALSKLTPQVSDMSLRAIRRAKIEIFLFPSAGLYFPEGAPLGTMFPRGPVRSTNPFDSCPKNLVDITMLRMAQNLLFVEMLKRKPQDVHIIRKSWTPLVLPDTDDDYYQHDMIPHRVRRDDSESNKTQLRISLSFSRSHLLFIAQVFRCLTRHLNDRLEFSMFIDGVNRILVRHGDDIGIVSHALIVYMIASTRFRRLMSSGNGFTLFLPALIKVYCESEADTAIREAIEYATHRFFALHEEVFVYQALQVTSTLVSQASAEEADWIAGHAYHLLSTLKANKITNDSAGIRDANKAQEDEAAMAITADERPQMFLASFRKEGKTGTEKLQSSLSTEIFDKKRFQPDNIVKMLLTVIAHDPTSQRAEYFLRLFRHFVSPLYDASKSARTVLGDGIEALGNIIVQKATKIKSSDPVHNRTRADGKESTIGDGRSLNGPPVGDMQLMRSDYLLLFAAFVKAGGAHKATSLQRAFDLVKLVLKDDSASPEAIDSVRQFFDLISQTFALRQDSKYATTLLREFAPIISVHGVLLDISGFLKNLTNLTSVPSFANDISFSKAVVEEVCRSALEVCELASQEGISLSLKFRPHLVKLLVESVCLLGTNVVAEIERRDPSPAFVCGIVIPFIIQLRTTTELATETQWTDSHRQEVHQLAWVQLLSYTLNVMQNKQSLGLKRQISLNRSNSSASLSLEENLDAGAEVPRKKSKRKPSGRTSVETSIRLALIFVALKAVVLRGEVDISSTFPGAWSRISAILRQLFRDGSAMFALRKQLSSVPPSPLISPFGSTSFGDLIDKAHDRQQKRLSSSSLHAHPSTSSYPSRPSSPSRSPSRRNSAQTFPCPRVVDYLSWSLLEFVCLRKSPLMVQFHTFMLEKALHLSEFLQPVDPIGGHISFVGPNQSRSRRSARPISSLYSKPRPRISSTNTTPDGSPYLGPSDPNVPFSGNLSSLSTSSGLNIKDLGGSPPPGQRGKRPIIHLGVSPPPPNMFLSPTFVPSSSMGSNLSLSPSIDEVSRNDIVLDARQAITITLLNSPLLVRNTYDRIRIVQKFLGYSTFLPVPTTLTSEMDIFLRTPGGENRPKSPHMSLGSGGDEEVEPEVRVWTRRQAGVLLLKEAQDLLHAWQVESAFSASIGDGGFSDGMSMTQIGDGGPVDITFVASSENMP